MHDRKHRRCAIYTRKSTEEGLEQSFNSLDAQREACAAYVLSQTHEGWEAINEHYDDGGWSGGTMDRPALRQLLADIKSKKVDTVVVYKVDRLTRSLADFAKIVELFDHHQVTFVSVTQAFNTTDSMGRLTLNVLLSFAQFEREVTAERIRDKVAASKKKGMWMGGSVPLGYRVQDRKLHIVEEEAITVRHIFERYCALGSIADLADELAEEGYRTKIRTFKTGEHVGGVTFGKGALGHMLKNPIVVGRVKHKTNVYEGQHDAIISNQLWDQTQALLNANRHQRRIGAGASPPSLLAGMLFDATGRPISPSQSRKGDRRYRYYVSVRKPGEKRGAGWHAPAGEIESLVTHAVAGRLNGSLPPEIAAQLSVDHLEVTHADRGQAATVLIGATVPLKRETLLALNARIELQPGKIIITIDEMTGDPIHRARIDVSYSDQRSSHAKLISIPPGESSSRPDSTLMKLMAQAHAAQRMLLSGESEPSVGHFSKRHLSRLYHLSWLAPDIVAAIMVGRQPKQLNARHLLRMNGIPIEWGAQRIMLGFA